MPRSSAAYLPFTTVWLAAMLTLLGPVGTCLHANSAQPALPPLANPTLHGSQGAHLPVGPHLAGENQVSGPVGGSRFITAPVGGHRYNVSVTAPLGLVGENQAVVDPKTSLVYSLNFIPRTVTVFGESNGTLVSYLQLPLAGTPNSVAIDSTQGVLYVGFAYPAGDGWVLGYNASTLSQVANYSNFSSAPGFQPALLAFDNLTGVLVVENSSAGLLLINTSASTISNPLSCPATDCHTGGIAFESFGGIRVVWASTGTQVLVGINESSNALLTQVTGAPNSTTGAVATDAQDGRIFVANASGPTVEVFNASNGFFAGDEPIGAYATSLNYDPASHNVLVAGFNQTPWLAALNGSNLSMVSQYFFTGDTGKFGSAVLDSNSQRLVTSGSLNGSSLAVSVPSMIPVIAYASFPAYRSAVAIAPELGAYFVSELQPNAVRQFNETTSAPGWVDGPSILPNASAALAVDPVVDHLYATDQNAHSVVVLSSSSGALTARIQFPPTLFPNSLSVDLLHHRLYVGGYTSSGTAKVFLVNSTTNAIIGNLSLPGQYPCRLAADPVEFTVFVSNCLPPNNLTEFDSVTLLEIASTQIGGFGPNTMSADGAGRLLVVDPRSTNLTVILPDATLSSTNVRLPAGLHGNAVGVDDRNGLVFVSASPIFGTDPLLVYRASSWTLLTQLALTSYSDLLAVDGVSGGIIAPGTSTGQLSSAIPIPAPSAPPGVFLTSGNRSMAISWAAASAPPSYPVLGYNISVSSPGLGTWQAVTNSISLSANLGGLNDGALYTVTVFAHSIGGNGPPSSPRSATPASIPYPPASVVVSGATNSSLNISWMPPAANGGASLLNYTLAYSKAPVGPWTNLSAGPTTTMTLANLSSHSTYYVRVVAWNMLGASHPSATMSGTTKAPPTQSPGPPTRSNTTTSSSILLPLVVVLIAIGLLGAAGLLLVRGRRPPSGANSHPAVEWTPPPSGPPPGAQ